MAAASQSDSSRGVRLGNTSVGTSLARVPGAPGLALFETWVFGCHPERSNIAQQSNGVEEPAPSAAEGPLQSAWQSSPAAELAGCPILLALVWREGGPPNDSILALRGHPSRRDSISKPSASALGKPITRSESLQGRHRQLTQPPLPSTPPLHPVHDSPISSPPETTTPTRTPAAPEGRPRREHPIATPAEPSSPRPAATR